MQGTPHPPLSMLHPSAIRRMIGLPKTDAICAFIPELMARQDLAERSFRQGITLLFLHKDNVLAALVFKERLFGFLHLPFGLALSGDVDDFSPALLLGILEDFRLGWLPPEKARALGGYVWRPTELPAEAEAFAPIFATGPLARCMHGYARILLP